MPGRAAVRGQPTAVDCGGTAQHAIPLGGTQADAGQDGGLQSGQVLLVECCCPRESPPKKTLKNLNAACICPAADYWGVLGGIYRRMI